MFNHAITKAGTIRLITIPGLQRPNGNFRPIITIRNVTTSRTPNLVQGRTRHQTTGLVRLRRPLRNQFLHHRTQRRKQTQFQTWNTRINFYPRHLHFINPHHLNRRPLTLTLPSFTHGLVFRRNFLVFHHRLTLVITSTPRR